MSSHKFNGHKKIQVDMKHIVKKLACVISAWVGFSRETEPIWCAYISEKIYFKELAHKEALKSKIYRVD